MLEDDCWLMFPGPSMSDVVSRIRMWTSRRVSSISMILEPLTQEVKMKKIRITLVTKGFWFTRPMKVKEVKKNA